MRIPSRHSYTRNPLFALSAFPRCTSSSSHGNQMASLATTSLRISRRRRGRFIVASHLDVGERYIVHAGGDSAAFHTGLCGRRRLLLQLLRARDARTPASEQTAECVAKLLTHAALDDDIRRPHREQGTHSVKFAHIADT